MSGTTPRTARTIAVHPTSRGFGWVAFEGPLSPYDWGLVGVKADKNARCIRKVEELFERFLPETLVLEAFERMNSSRADRIARLCRAIHSLATDRGIDVAVYTRRDVKQCFAGVGAVTRDEIAAAVVRHVDALRHWLPKARQPWESEHRRLAVFSAAALVLTHYQRGSAYVLHQLM